MISIILTTYKRPERLNKAIKSVLAQTYRDWELIVVHDGDEESRQIEDKRIAHIYRKENYGTDTRPKNEGILASKGEYIAFLDDDCAMRPDHLQALYNDIKDTDLDLVYGDRWLIHEDKSQRDGIGIYYEFNLSHLFEQNYIDTSDVLIRRESLFKVGGLDERYKKYIDWNLWLRMAKAGMKFKHVPLIITDYHIHKDMKSIRIQTEGDKKFRTNTPEWDAYDLIIRHPFLGKIPYPKVAIYTLTYDRLDLTKKCFESLKKTAGYSFDHFVVDNGSTDGTKEWLKTQDVTFIDNPANLGISKASNQALDQIKGYDIIVKIDNDVIFTTPGWLSKMVGIWGSNNMLALSPYPQGLKDSPGGAMRIGYGRILGEMVGMTKHLGGACVFVDARAYNTFRWDEHDFLHGIQDVEFSRYILLNGYQMGYLENYYMVHDTLKQQDEYKDYFERRKSEKTTRPKL